MRHCAELFTIPFFLSFGSLFCFWESCVAVSPEVHFWHGPHFSSGHRLMCRGVGGDGRPPQHPPFAGAFTAVGAAGSPGVPLAWGGGYCFQHTVFQ